MQLQFSISINYFLLQFSISASYSTHAVTVFFFFSELVLCKYPVGGFVCERV